MIDASDFDQLVADAEEIETGPNWRVIEETILVGLLSPTIAPGILEKARPKDFAFDIHRRFAAVVFPMVAQGRYVDAVTFQAYADEAGELEEDGEAKKDGDKLTDFADLVIAKAAEDPPSAGQVETYLDIFEKSARQREAKTLVVGVGAALDKGEKSPEVAAADVFKVVANLELSQRLTGVAKTEGEELEAFFAALEARQDSKNDFQGLDTGFNHLNRVINGLGAGLIVLAAMPSTGKTTFAKQIADHVAEKHTDAAVLFVSLEQSKEELRIKTLSRLSGIENRDLQRGRLDTRSEGWSKVVEAKATFAGFADRLQVLEGDRLTTVDRIRLAATQFRRKTLAGRLLIIVDYLQIVPTDDAFNDIRQKVGFVTSELRRLGRDLDAPVLAIASVNRASYDKTKARLDVFKESGEIEFSADVAMVMKEDGDKKKGEENYLGVTRKWKKVFLDVVKNRNGEKARIQLEFYPEVSRFREVSKGELPED